MKINHEHLESRIGCGRRQRGRSFKAAFHQDTPVGKVYKEFISDESTRASSSRRWRSSEEFQTTAEFEGRVSKFRDRNWGKVFTLSVIKVPRSWCQGRLPEELGLWVGLPERAACTDKELHVCAEEANDRLSMHSQERTTRSLEARTCNISS